MPQVREVKKEKSMPKGPKTKELPKETELVIRARFIRMAPRKLRLVSGLILKKPLSQAMDILRFSSKAAAKPILLVLKNAASQAKDRNLSEDIHIKNIMVNEGPKLKRRRIIHRGRSTSILKRMSHITVVLSADGNHKSQITNSMPKGKQIANKQKTKFKK